jgi:hypothetical protein
MVRNILNVRTIIRIIFPCVYSIRQDDSSKSIDIFTMKSLVSKPSFQNILEYLAPQDATFRACFGAKVKSKLTHEKG